MAATSRTAGKSIFGRLLQCSAISNGPRRIIDYDEIEAMAVLEQPKLIFVGATAYPRLFDLPALPRLQKSKRLSRG